MESVVTEHHARSKDKSFWRGGYDANLSPIL